MELFLFIFAVAIIISYIIGPPKLDSYDQDWHDRMNDL